MRPGKAVILLSLIAGVVTWIHNAIVERLYYYGPTRNFWDLLLFHIPPEEFFDRVITMAAFLLLGILVARMLDRQIAAEERLKLLAAELERNNRELEQFAYMASHDLKEPLVTVGGYLQLLERRHSGALDGTAGRYLRNALAGIQRMEQLIGDLLAYSRAGGHGEQFQPVDPSAILDAALANLSGVIETRNVVVTRDPLPEVLADDTQLLQLLRHRDCPGACGRDLPGLPAASQPEGVSGDGSRIGNLQENRGMAWRTHLGRVQDRRGGHLLLYHPGRGFPPAKRGHGP